MQNKPFDFKLPNTLTKKSFKHIYSQARRIVRESHIQYNKDFQAYGEEVAAAKRDRAYKLIDQRYGYQINQILGHKVSYAYFWDPVSHFKYDRSFVSAGMKGNSAGHASQRKFQKPLLSMYDPKHPLYLGGGITG